MRSKNQRFYILVFGLFAALAAAGGGVRAQTAAADSAETSVPPPPKSNADTLNKTWLRGDSVKAWVVSAIETDGMPVFVDTLTQSPKVWRFFADGRIFFEQRGADTVRGKWRAKDQWLFVSQTGEGGYMTLPVLKLKEDALVVEAPLDPPHTAEFTFKPFDGKLPAPPTGNPAPTLPQGLPWRATFHTTRNASFEALGNAFPLKNGPDGRRWFVTALNFFHESRNGIATIRMDELPSVVDTARFFGEFDYKPKALSSRFVPLPGAEYMGAPQRDVAVFAPDSGADALLLAEIKPKMREPLWLAGQAGGGAPVDRKLHRCEAAYVGDSILMLAFPDTTLDLGRNAGAPVLNSRGEVVGMLSYSAVRDGKLRGYCNPASGLRRALIDAARQSAVKPE